MQKEWATSYKAAVCGFDPRRLLTRGRELIGKAGRPGINSCFCLIFDAQILTPMQMMRATSLLMKITPASHQIFGAPI